MNAAVQAMPGDPLADPARQAALQQAANLVRAGRSNGVVTALRAYVQAGDAEAMALAALAHALDGDALAAAPLFVAAAKARPDTLHPLCDLAPLIPEPNALARAERVYQAVRDLTPEDPRFWHACSLYYTQAFRFAEAVSAARRAVQLDGGTAVTVNQLGIALTAGGEMAEGLAVFEQAVARWPDGYAAFSNLACTQAALGAFDDALSAYRQAISLAPTEPQMRLNHAICLLKAGRMTQGWTEYEWRLQLPGHTDLPAQTLLPSLAEDTRLDGRTVLITHEEGLGDTLQFLRFIPALAAHGARVVLWVPQAVAGIAGRVAGVAEVVSGELTAIRYDWHCPFMSLPRALAATSSRDGAPVPYLRAGSELVARWAPHLPSGDTLRVGLVWAGASRPHLHWAMAVDRKRSVTLSQLAAFGRLRGVSFVSLQMGPPTDQLFDPPPGLRIHDSMHEVRDMDDTAALIAGLDAVVSVDTSVAHLAGGLGKPVLLLDRFDNCWRWGHGSETTALYPGMRIFRQPRPEDWATPIAAIAAALQEMADSRGRRGKPGRKKRSFLKERTKEL